MITDFVSLSSFTLRSLRSLRFRILIQTKTYIAKGIAVSTDIG